MDDDQLRKTALDHAMHMQSTGVNAGTPYTSGPTDADEVVEDAEKFLVFLRGDRDA